jgi:hypothetical protein
MQASGSHASPYGRAVKAQYPELRARDYTVLPAGKARDQLPARGWQRIGADFATYFCHLARVALAALPVGDVCNGCVTAGARGPPGSPRAPAERSADVAFR